MRCKASDCFTCPYPDCINDYVEIRKPMTPEQKAKKCAYAKKRREAAKAAGLCIVCAKKPAMSGRTRCIECNILVNRCTREARRRAGVLPRDEMDGVHRCKICGKAELKDGFKVCETCYGKVTTTLSKNRAKPRKGWNDYLFRRF